MGDDPVLEPSPDRLQLLPIRYHDLWRAYKVAVSAFWTVEEVDLSHDLQDWAKLTTDEQHLVKHVLAYFSQADNLIVENLAARFLCDVQIPEARAFYTWQGAIEGIHAEMYAVLIDTYVVDYDEKQKLFKAPSSIPAVGRKMAWAQKWINDSDSFAERLVAFGAVEGIHFSASFATIFYLRKRGLMPGLCLSNNFISRDEGQHADFACLLYKHLRHKLPLARVHEIIGEATDAELAFVDDALPVAVLGLNAEALKEYVRFVSDRMLTALGYDVLYKAHNPLDYMESQSLLEKSNFFEHMPSSYQKAGVATESKREVIFDADF